MMARFISPREYMDAVIAYHLLRSAGESPNDDADIERRLGAVYKHHLAGRNAQAIGALRRFHQQHGGGTAEADCWNIVADHFLHTQRFTGVDPQCLQLLQNGVGQEADWFRFITQEEIRNTWDVRQIGAWIRERYQLLSPRMGVLPSLQPPPAPLTPSPRMGVLPPPPAPLTPSPRTSPQGSPRVIYGSLQGIEAHPLYRAGVTTGVQAEQTVRREQHPILRYSENIRGLVVSFADPQGIVRHAPIQVTSDGQYAFKDGIGFPSVDMLLRQYNILQ